MDCRKDLISRTYSKVTWEHMGCWAQLQVPMMVYKKILTLWNAYHISETIRTFRYIIGTTIIIGIIDN